MKIAQIINNDKINIYTLDNVPSDVPWSVVANMTATQFMQSSFRNIESTLVKKKGYFDEYLAKRCVEVAFIEIEVEGFNEKKWFAFYLFEENKKETYSYAIGGFPLDSNYILELKKEGYPELLTTFFELHGFWNYYRESYLGKGLSLDEIQKDFALDSFEENLEYLSCQDIGYPKLYGEMSVEKFIDEHHLFEKEDGLYESIGIDGVDDFLDDFEMDDMEQDALFIDEYFPKATLFKDYGTGDYDFFLKDKKQKMWIFKFCHDGSSPMELVDNYESYLFDCFNEWRDIEHLSKCRIDSKIERDDVANVNPKIEAFMETIPEKTVIYIYEGDFITKGNLALFASETFSLIVTGNLIVSETIGIFPWNKVGLFVGGDVSCKNLINPNAHLFVGGNLKVEEIGLLKGSNRNIEIQGECSVNTLVSFYGSPKEVKFKKEISSDDYRLFKEYFYEIEEENKVTFKYYHLNYTLFGGKEVV